MAGGPNIGGAHMRTTAARTVPPVAAAAAPARHNRRNNAATAAATTAAAATAASSVAAAAVMLFSATAATAVTAAAGAGGARAPSVGIIGGSDSSEYDGYVVNPAALDAALHLAGTCHAAESEAMSGTMVLRVPAAIASFAATAVPSRPPLRAAALCGPDGARGGSGAVPISGDFVLQGHAAVMGLSLRPMGSGAGAGGGGAFAAAKGGKAKAAAAAVAAESDIPGKRAIMYRLESLAEVAPLERPQQVGTDG